MRKLIALVLCLMMAAALMPASAEGAVKTGVAAVVALTPADATENKDGQVRNEVTMAAVAVDENGVITDCRIDAYRADIKFSQKGELVEGTELRTKSEMGADYGMGAIAPKGEWNAQAEGFAAYCVGKTLDQIKGIALTDGKATDEDILATTTIGIGDFVEVVALAVEKAADHGAQAGDALYLVATAETGSSKAATENKDGSTQLDATYAAVTVNADSVITSIVIDAVQPKATFSAEGKVTSDTTEKVLSKLEKGDAYGMNGIAPKGEWYVQAEGFGAYVTGKTVAEAAGIAIGEDGKATDEDILATTTIGIGDFVALLNKLAK